MNKKKWKWGAVKAKTDSIKVKNNVLKNSFRKLIN